MNPTTEIIPRLSRPLDRKRVRLHSAPGQGAVPFLEDLDVIHTANQTFDYRWSFDLLSEPHLVLWEQAVTTWDSRRRQRTPVLDPETGQQKMQRTGTVYLTGKVTIELDGMPYTHADVGRLSFTGDTSEALELALSGAASDCLKRCLRQLGSQFGLDLMAKESVRSAGQSAVVNNGHQAGSHRPTIEGVKPVTGTEQNGLSMTRPWRRFVLSDQAKTRTMRACRWGRCSASRRASVCWLTWLVSSSRPIVTRFANRLKSPRSCCWPRLNPKEAERCPIKN
ncbi:MAG TPA: Rad52/Rad22 family DNA repair protein [Anaerolineales bacterium]|nr:Rad52/Rad22 family DNA repair protein [Anaerolineales bacterium]